MGTGVTLILVLAALVQVHANVALSSLRSPFGAPQSASVFKPRSQFQTPRVGREAVATHAVPTLLPYFGNPKLWNPEEGIGKPDEEADWYVETTKTGRIPVTQKHGFAIIQNVKYPQPLADAINAADFDIGLGPGKYMNKASVRYRPMGPGVSSPGGMPVREVRVPGVPVEDLMKWLEKSGRVKKSHAAEMYEKNIPLKKEMWKEAKAKYLEDLEAKMSTTEYGKEDFAKIKAHMENPMTPYGLKALLRSKPKAAAEAPAEEKAPAKEEAPAEPEAAAEEAPAEEAPAPADEGKEMALSAWSLSNMFAVPTLGLVAFFVGGAVTFSVFGFRHGTSSLRKEPLLNGHS